MNNLYRQFVGNKLYNGKMKLQCIHFKNYGMYVLGEMKMESICYRSVYVVVPSHS